MGARKPYLRITGPDGADIGARLGRDLVGVQITDLEGGESDECVIRVRRSKPWRAAPPPGTRFEVHVGWDEDGAIMTGSYQFQRLQISGDPEGGQETHLVCRAADFQEALKRVDSEHFDRETGHRTYGDVLRTLADRAGLGAAIDPQIAAIPLAGGYLLRWKQSAIGFATDIADDLGALVKPQAGFLSVRRQGSFTTPSGDRLTTIRIPYSSNYAFQVEIEPRYDFGEVSTPWYDPATGRPTDILKELSRGAARFILPHIGGSEALARAMTEAASQRLEAEKAFGMFESAGQPFAVAGAPVVPEGFGPDVDNVSWEAQAVYHDILPDVGWTTTIETREAIGFASVAA